MEISDLDMQFNKYMHIERYGNDEVQGIELGECYVFPKIDGTNGSIWLNKGLHAGSRNREISIEADNHGFCAWVMDNSANITPLLTSNPHLRLFGEWLVPHSLKTYRDDAWKRFYIFDIYDSLADRYLSYDEYQPLLVDTQLDYITPLCSMRNATYDALLHELKNNYFLIKEGEGSGEGIVIKNYTYKNQYGRTTWAKIVTNLFKEKRVNEMGHTVKSMKHMIEQTICDKYVTQHLVDKVYAKIVNEMEGWNSKYIPRLLSTVYHDLISEELWDIVKKMKNPIINFRTLNSLIILRIKEVRPELF